MPGSTGFPSYCYPRAKALSKTSQSLAQPLPESWKASLGTVAQPGINASRTKHLDFSPQTSSPHTWWNLTLQGFSEVQPHSGRLQQGLAFRPFPRVFTSSQGWLLKNLQRAGLHISLSECLWHSDGQILSQKFWVLLHHFNQRFCYLQSEGLKQKNEYEKYTF